jgi:hypothetical protein
MLQLQRKQSSLNERRMARPPAAAPTVPLGLQDDWTEKHRPPSLATMKIHHTKLRALRQWFALVRDGASRADRPLVLLVYGKSGTGKRTACEFLAAEAGVALHRVDVLDASTFAVPRRGDGPDASSDWRPAPGASRTRGDELMATHTTREVSDPTAAATAAAAAAPTV